MGSARCAFAEGNGTGSEDAFENRRRPWPWRRSLLRCLLLVAAAPAAPRVVVVVAGGGRARWSGRIPGIAQGADADHGYAWRPLAAARDDDDAAAPLRLLLPPPPQRPLPPQPQARVQRSRRGRLHRRHTHPLARGPEAAHARTHSSRARDEAGPRAAAQQHSSAPVRCERRAI